MINFSQIPKVTKILLIVNIAIFVIASLSNTLGYINAYYGAYYPLLPNFEYYQILSSMFLHASFEHLFFNMFGLWMFGGQVENYFGENRYLILYFLSGIGAFLLQSLWMYFEFPEASKILINEGWQQVNPSTLKEMTHPMVGASGALCGVLGAFAVLYPNEKLMLIFFPVPIKAKYFIAGYIIVEAILGVLNVGMIAHFAHVGGALVGFALTKSWMKNRFRIN